MADLTFARTFAAALACLASFAFAEQGYYATTHWGAVGHSLYPTVAEACRMGAYEVVEIAPGNCVEYFPSNGECTTGRPDTLCSGLGRIANVGEINCLSDPAVSVRNPAGIGSFSCSGTAPDVATNAGNRCRQFGNPCDAATGNKFQREVDYVSPDGQLRLIRFYNSSVFSGGRRFGVNWTDHYTRSLTIASPIVRAQRPDGRVIRFVQSGQDYNLFDIGGERLEAKRDGGGAVIGWRLTYDDANEIESYDLTGGLVSIEDRNGNRQDLSYSDASTPPAVAPAPGLLIKVTGSYGRSLSFTYTSNSRVATVTDPSGQVYSYTYNAAGIENLATVTYPDTKVRTYSYADPSLPRMLTGITDEEGAAFASWTYDSTGRAVSSERAGGALKTTFTFNADGTTTVREYVTATTFTERTHSFQTIKNLALGGAVTGNPGGSTAPSSSYDTNGFPASRSDWNGNRTNYVHDARGLETSRTEGLTAGGSTTPQTRTITTEWHPTYRLATRVAEPLRITTNVYGAPDDPHPGNRGSLLSRTVQATTDANGALGFSATMTGSPRTWTYTYNASGQVLTVNGPRTDVSDVTTYTYYANNDPDLGKRGNVATITNAAGHRTDITAYNAHGQPLTIVDPNDLTTTLTYDTRQRLTSRNVGGETTTYAYDGVGQLTKVTLPDGSFLSYGYDAAHRLTSITDNQGNRIAYTLDVMGNRTLEQVFDPANALAQTRSRVYSNLNRLFQELGAQNQTTEYGYDNQGNVTSVKDPLNRITSNQFDPLNRLKQVTDPALGVTQYAYNGLDALTQVTDPRNLVTGYTVDGLGTLTLQASPDTGNTTNTYDVAGNLLTQTDAKGQVTSYAYDALNRVTLITFHDGSKQAYAYDQGTNGIGRLSSITETKAANQQTSLIAYAYSPHGRTTSETRTVSGLSYVVGYSYDSAGRLSGITYPSGRTLAYTFDSLGRVSGVNTTFDGQTQPVVSSVAYHPFGGVKSYTLGNGQAYTRNYDQDGRIGSYTLGAKTFSIGYDATSRIEFISEFGNPANSNTYGYDSLDRLTSAVIPGTPFGYSYDAVGNRLSKTAGAATDTLTYSTTSNRIATLTPASGPPRSFVFDPNGSTTGDGLNTYAYDVRGRMVQATSTAGTTGYQVNALGQRVRKTNSQGDTVFHYDTAGRLIAETSPAGVSKRELIYLGDIPVGVVQ